MSRFVANVGHALSVGMFWTIPCISLEGRIRNTVADCDNSSSEPRATDDDNDENGR